MLLIVLKEFKKLINLKPFQCQRKFFKNKNILPVKGVEQDEDSNDEDTKEFLNDCIQQSEHTAINPMTKLKNQIIKAQEEYITNNKQPDLPMYKHTEIQNPEDIIPPTYEVRMKNARQKKQDKYDKLASKAF